MKEPGQVRSLALNHRSSLSPLRSITVAIVISLAFAAAIYFAIG